MVLHNINGRKNDVFVLTNLIQTADKTGIAYTVTVCTGFLYKYNTRRMDEAP